MLGTWLPMAMATVVQAIYGAHGATPPKTEAIMAWWGLPSVTRDLEDARDAVTDRTIEMLEND